MKPFSLRNAHYFSMVLVPKLLAFASAQGILIFIAEVQRHIERQTELYNSGRSWTLDSDHLLCTALDLELLKRGDDDKLRWVQDENHPHWKRLGKKWESLDPDCYWGGRWDSKDVYHFGYNARKDD